MVSVVIRMTLLKKMMMMIEMLMTILQVATWFFAGLCVLCSVCGLALKPLPKYHHHPSQQYHPCPQLLRHFQSFVRIGKSHDVQL